MGRPPFHSKLYIYLHAIEGPMSIHESGLLLLYSLCGVTNTHCLGFLLYLISDICPHKMGYTKLGTCTLIRNTHYILHVTNCGEQCS